MKTSIIVLTYNQLNYTKECIESIRLYTKPDYEIIIVDNASTDGTVDWLKEQTDITSIFNDVNKGFPAGCNQGILKACGDVIVLLNNDTIVTPRWLDNLLICLNSSDKIGAVGVGTNFALVEAQFIPAEYKGIEELILFADKFNVSNPKLWRDRIRLCGVCFAVKKTVINKVGLLDERFFPGYFDDDDYSFRIRQLGYKLIFCADTFIHHHGNVSFKNNPDTAKMGLEIIETNHKRFIEKWGFTPTYHPHIRFDIKNMITKSDSQRHIRVLEIGCGCGGTLLEIKNFFPYAELFGIEANPCAANIACGFAKIQTGDAEKIDFDYPREFFDYILFPNTLEYLINPWRFLSKMKEYLRYNGQVIASIPNVMHFSAIYSLLKGAWNTNHTATPEKAPLRFFTLSTITQMFEKSGYTIMDIEKNTPTHTQTDDVKNLLEYLHVAVPPKIREELLVAQYIVKANCKC